MSYTRFLFAFLFSIFLIGFAAGGVTVYVVTPHISACKCGGSCHCGGK